MRRLLIVMLSLALAGSAHAQASQTHTYKGFGLTKSQQQQDASRRKFTPLPGSEPYHPHAAPSTPKPIGSSNGGEGFKPYTPFKGGSVYSHPDPAKPKSRTY